MTKYDKKSQNLKLESFKSSSNLFSSAPPRGSLLAAHVWHHRPGAQRRRSQRSWRSGPVTSSDIQWHPVTSSDIQWHPVTSSDIQWPVLGELMEVGSECVVSDGWCLLMLVECRWSWLTFVSLMPGVPGSLEEPPPAGPVRSHQIPQIPQIHDTNINGNWILKWSYCMVR